VAFFLLRTWDGQQRGLLYMLRIDLTDGTRIVNDYGMWPSTPDAGQITGAVSAAIARAEAAAVEAARPRPVPERDRLDAGERLVVRAILEVDATSDHVAGLTISGANKVSIQLRLAIVRATLVDALAAMRAT